MPEPVLTWVSAHARTVSNNDKRYYIMSPILVNITLVCPWVICRKRNAIQMWAYYCEISKALILFFNGRLLVVIKSMSTFICTSNAREVYNLSSCANHSAYDAVIGKGWSLPEDRIWDIYIYVHIYINVNAFVIHVYRHKYDGYIYFALVMFFHGWTCLYYPHIIE